jgi:hypothetical protein
MLWTNLLQIVPKSFTDIVDIEAVLRATNDALGPPEDWSVPLDLSEPHGFAIDAYEVYKNFYVQLCDEVTLGQWDLLLDIPDPPVDVAEHRAFILLTLQTMHQITLPWLTKALKLLIGDGLFTITIDYPHYCLYLDIVSGAPNVVAASMRFMRRAIPAHIDLSVVQNVEGSVTVHTGVVPTVALEYDMDLSYTDRELDFDGSEGLSAGGVSDSAFEYEMYMDFTGHETTLEGDASVVAHSGGFPNTVAEYVTDWHITEDDMDVDGSIIINSGGIANTVMEYATGWSFSEDDMDVVVAGTAPAGGFPNTTLEYVTGWHITSADIDAVGAKVASAGVFANVVKECSGPALVAYTPQRSKLWSSPLGWDTQH